MPKYILKLKKKLLFTSNFERGRFARIINDIYLMDLRTQSSLRLTSQGYNEHAGFSVDGKKIIWMSNVGNKNYGTDLWMMNNDGTNKIRLTCFNHNGCKEYAGTRIVVSDWALSPDGTKIVSRLLTGRQELAGWVWGEQTGKIVLIDLGL